MLLELDIEEEVDDYENFEEEENGNFDGIFAADLREHAKNHLVLFFKDREMHCGGFLSRKKLLHPRNVSLVMNTSIIDSTKMIYGLLEGKNQFQERDVLDKTITEDVKLVMEIFRNCYQLGIPKQFAGGILMLYFQYCEGIF